MIDTIRIPISIVIPQTLMPQKGWTKRSDVGWRRIYAYKGGGRRVLIQVISTSRKGKTETNDRVYDRVVELSLATLLFGDNRRLIKNQQELDAAFSKLEAGLRKLDPKFNWAGDPERIDLTWHVPGHPPDFFDAHYRLDHPDIPKAKVILYRDETLIWQARPKEKGNKEDGKRIRDKWAERRIQFYDKQAKSYPGLHSNFVRLSVELRRDALAAALPQLIGRSTHLDFLACYHFLRETILKFEKSMTYSKPMPKLRIPAKKLLERYQIEWSKLLPKQPPAHFTHEKWGDIPIIRS